MGTPSNPMPPFIGSFITVNGAPLEAHLQKIDKFLAGYDTMFDTGVEPALQDAKVYSQGIVPVRTGYLRSTIDWEKVARFKWLFGASANYAKAVEEGTFRMRPRPYIAPAMIRLRDQRPLLVVSQVTAMLA